MSEPAVDQLADLPSGTRICFREHGRPGDPPILLVAGLGEDQTFWGDSFVTSLLDGGHRVVTMDNRDVGRSSFATTPAPAVWRQALTRPRDDGYTLTDMARDCIGVLDHLEIEQVHLVGRSMGGMIAQVVAATAPERVSSLTSIYSTTGSSEVGQPARSTIRRLVLAPTPRTRTDAVIDHLRITQHIAGAAYPMDEVAEAAVAARSWDRCDGDAAAGVARQIQAIQLSGDRTAALRTIEAPTLVIHGDRDLMVAPSGGAATAAAIPGSQHVVVAGMGHHLPEALVSLVARQIEEHVRGADRGGRPTEVA